MTTVLVLLVCLSSVVRAYGPNDESSVAGMVKAMAKQITTLTAALEARQMDRKHIQLTTGGEVVELVRIADVKALTEQMEAYERKMDAQDARLAAQELARITELDATTAKLAVQEARISELSATVAQLLATGARPMPVDADKTLETTAARRLREAGSPPPSPSQPPPSPSPPPPPAWPPLPATANELRISGRHTAVSFNTNVDGVEPFRCTGVSDRRLTCSGELLAADFRTASGISLEELAQFAGMVPPSAPPPSTPPPEPPTMPAPPTYFLPRTWSLEGGSTGGAVNWVSAQGDILLHFRVDTIESRGSEALVMNSRAGGAWQREERTNYAAVKLPNGRFAFTVRVDASGFLVSTRGGQKLWLFRHHWQTPWRIFSYVQGYETTVETTLGHGRVGLFAGGVEVYTTPILAPRTLSAFSDTLQLPAGVEDFDFKYIVGGGARGHNIQIKNFAWSWLPPP